MHRIEDRVAETTATVGAGALALAGPLAGYRAFSAVCAVGDTVPYMIEAVTPGGVLTGEWECGIGTYTAPATLARTIVTSSSNGGALVAFAAGTKRVALALLATQLRAVPEIASGINHIGIPGQMGFGVGICPALPAGYSRLAGTEDPASATYGNYRYSDGSDMCWIPAHFYKWGTGLNGLAVNVVSILPRSAFATVADANLQGYALGREFYDGGIEQPGFFIDKWLCSNNAGIASSVKLGAPLSSAAVHNPFSGLAGAPSNTYSGAIASAKTRGAAFFPASIFQRVCLARLALAHAQASSSSTHCAWWTSAGTTSYPKGCNNNALADHADLSVTFTWDGYAGNNSALTGSASNVAKTTHNGQLSGVADLNGNLWEVNLGLTSNGANFYLLKTAVAMRNLTAGNTLATDAWGAAGIAAQYDDLGATYGALLASSTAKVIGHATNKVFDEAVSGLAWAATCAGIPLVGGVGGTNAFGNDYLYDYRVNELCPIGGGSWNTSSAAGVWALNLDYARTYSSNAVGFRAASYL
ncbi:MAG: hypothetical protein KJ007_07175 [Burkholderiales bacterium]|nr:hypothetical protein [Burkholderiales bacterium]